MENNLTDREATVVRRDGSKELVGLSDGFVVCSQVLLDRLELVGVLHDLGYLGARPVVVKALVEDAISVGLEAVEQAILQTPGLLLDRFSGRLPGRGPRNDGHVFEHGLVNQAPCLYHVLHDIGLWNLDVPLFNWLSALSGLFVEHPIFLLDNRQRRRKILATGLDSVGIVLILKCSLDLCFLLVICKDLRSMLVSPFKLANCEVVVAIARWNHSEESMSAVRLALHEVGGIVVTS